MKSQTPILEIQHLTKTYRSGDKPLTVLDDISFALEPGISCAIVGPSGSGKTTLLGLCAGLDQATSGSVTLKGHLLNKMNEDQLAAVRNRHIGFIFQSFQLIPTLTAIENVMVPVELRGDRYQDVYTRASQLLESVGLADRMDHYPTQLSGGEQQRVGIARAFINKPDILFADEPTGNLDTETGRQIESILFDLNRSQGTTLIIVTHDPELAEQCDRVIRLKSGQIASDEYTSRAPEELKVVSGHEN
jgi:putative ABC transport system ATP-binding protein